MTPDDEQLKTPTEHLAAAERLLKGADGASRDTCERYFRAAEVHAQIAQAQTLAEGFVALDETLNVIADRQ